MGRTYKSSRVIALVLCGILIALQASCECTRSVTNPCIKAAEDPTLREDLEMYSSAGKNAVDIANVTKTVLEVRDYLKIWAALPEIGPTLNEILNKAGTELATYLIKQTKAYKKIDTHIRDLMSISQRYEDALAAATARPTEKYVNRLKMEAIRIRKTIRVELELLEGARTAWRKVAGFSKTIQQSGQKHGFPQALNRFITRIQRNQKTLNEVAKACKGKIHCADPNHMPFNRQDITREEWMKYSCKMKGELKDKSIWRRCLKTTDYTKLTGQGCPGRPTLCCPPE